MKYIKTYEDMSNNNKYWKVNTEMPYFAISLDKLLNIRLIMMKIQVII